MKRLIHFVVVLLFAATSIQAQKIDAQLTNLLPSIDGKRAKSAVRGQQQEIDTTAVKQSINVSFNSDGTVKGFSVIVMLKEGAECPTERLQKLGVNIREVIGRMLILTVPAESLMALGDMDEVESVSADAMCEVMNNVGRDKTNVSEVNTLEKALSHNLPQAYTGKGVVVGIVDTGIDYNHAAFRNADGSTRVKMGIRYFSNTGYETNTTASEIAEMETDDSEGTHGTHVAGTAAGSIVEGAKYQGMAPEADIVLCGLCGALYESNILTMIKTIFDYAQSVGKPCVVNASIGFIVDFHDDTSSIVQGLKEYYKTDDDKKGRICVFSSSNSADYQAAIYTTLPAADSDGYNLKTVLGESRKYVYEEKEVNGYVNISNFFYNVDGSELDVDVKVVDVTTGALYTLAEKPLYSRAGVEITSLNKTRGINSRNNKWYVKYTLYNTTCAFHEPNLKLAYFVKSTAGKTFRALDNRRGKTTGFHSCNLQGYEDGCDNGAFNAWICGEQIIGVGSYYSTNSYVNIDGMTSGYSDMSMVDKADANSSWGVDDNGISHPDVIAPGGCIISAYNIHDFDYFDWDGNYYPQSPSSNVLVERVSLFNRWNYYGSMEGTSMATPHVTGIIALWLQANPNLTYADVRDIIKETSMKDKYVTNTDFIPSHDVRQVGSGKIDALAGLQKILGTTDIKTVGADGLRQATPATMYDVDDNCYNILGQRVSKNTKGLIIYKGKKFLNQF